MAKYKKRNPKKDSKTVEDIENKIERIRLEKWRPGNRNFPQMFGYDNKNM